MRFKTWCVLGLAVILAACGGGAPKEKTPLVVFAAGSLIQPFDDLEKAFERQYPEIDVQSEYHGSIQVMRHATELHEKIDVVATADQSLIPMLMYNRTDEDTGKPYANWHIRFASNRLGVAYTAKSKYAGEINASNWYEILGRPDVRVGIADPRFDAAGYRALMVFKLAEGVYHQPDLLARTFAGQFKTPLRNSVEDEVAVIGVPEILETRKDAHIVLRGASIQLIALLESGDLDYAFEYESVIQQHGLELVALPPELNLGDAAFGAQYAGVRVELDFRRFASVRPEFGGEQIGYGITIPANAPHPAQAAKFIAFLLGPEGRAVFTADHHPLFDPPAAVGHALLPRELQPLCVPAP